MTCQNCGDEYSSLLSDTGSKGASLDGLDLSKSSSSSQPKRKENKYKSWNFQYRLQTYILGVHGVSTDEKKTLLVEHLQTRLGQLGPQAVLSVTSTSSCPFRYLSFIFMKSPGRRYLAKPGKAPASNCAGKPPVSK